MSQPYDTPEWRLSVLKASPYFRFVPEPQLLTLALAMRLQEWPREHIFLDTQFVPGPGQAPENETPLSMIASGKVALIQRFTTAGSRRLLGPGDMYGLEGVHAWLFPNVKQDAQFIANTVDTTWCLELYPAAFKAVLGDDPLAEPLRSILNAWALTLAYPTSMAALLATQQLSCMRQDQLQALIQLSSVVTIGPGQPLPGISKGAAPSAVYVLLSGQLDRIAAPIDPASPPLEKTCVGKLDPGQIVGLAEIFDDQPMTYSAIARDATLLCISKDVWLEAPAKIPGFLRGIAQAVGKPPLYVGLIATPFGQLLSATSTAVVPAFPGHEMAILAATDHLAEYIATEFREDVLLVKVFKDAPPSPPMAFSDWENIDYLPLGKVQRIEVSLSDFNVGWLQAWITSCWDVIIIEPMDLGPYNEPDNPFLKALVALNIPLTTSLLLDTPDAWDEIAEWVPQSLLRWSLPTAMLGADDGLGLPPAWIPQGGGGFLDTMAQKAIGLIDGTLTSISLQFQQQAAMLGPERSTDGVVWPAWPVGTARMLLNEAALDAITLGSLDSDTTLAVSRWARALTRRRVGVAIGGAGAISFIGSAMIEGLLGRGIPIDMVSGTSFGAVVGGFYAAHGVPGLRQLEQSWPSLFAALSYSYFTTFPIALWGDCHLDFANLNDLPVAFFPVATLATNEHEWPIRGGTIGNGLRSSGSLPPFAPTVHGKLRLIDGGYSADVPCQVLSDEGADIIVAVNPYAFPATLPQRKLWIPFISPFLMEQNPLLRALDWTRGYQMLWRFAAQSQLSYADVVYNNDDSHGNPVAFFAGPWFVHQAQKSGALDAALHQASAAWNALLGDPEAYLTTSGTPTHVVLTIPVRFTRTLGFVGTTPGIQQTITQPSIALLDRAARTILNYAPITGMLMINIQATGEGSSAADAALAQTRGERVKQFLVYAGIPAVHMQVLASSGPSEFVTLELNQP